MSVESSSVCARCAAQGTSCCVSVEGVSGPPLTPADIERISTATGRAATEFVVEREVDLIEHLAWEQDDPATRGLVREGRVRSLARRGDECIFLSANGCELGSARPLLCQRFPFMRVNGVIDVKPGGFCLAVDEAADLPQLLTMLGTGRKQLQAIDEQLQRELTK